ELLTRVKSLLRIKALHDEIETKNRLLRTLFGRYVSAEVAAEIVADPGRHLKLGGEKREVTVLFGDLRGFTPLAEQLDPQDAVDILNIYLTLVIDTVFRFGGTLDKFRGDGFMAVVGVRVGVEDDQATEVRGCLAVQGGVRVIILW